jgi:drug/metabolite transporter (DMT)-like permease
MFFLAAIIATIGYALQSTLMASYYRSMDRLSAVALRGLSLGLSMAPLLLFVPGADFGRVPGQILLILGAAVFAALGNVASARAFSFLPVGVATASSMGFASIFAALIGFVFVGERLTSAQLVFGVLILLGVLLLGISRSTGPLPKEHSVPRGIVSSLFFGIFLGCAYSLVGMVSRELHPFLVGYLWEFIIGIVAAVIAVCRRFLGGPGLSRVPVRDFLGILLFSAPTLFGTGFYALAMSMGPIAVATAIISTMMVVNTILAAVFYGERLTARQWGLLLVVCLLVAGLKIFG